MTTLMLTFSDPQDFNQLKLGLCLPPEQLHEYACPLILNLPNFVVGETLLPQWSPHFLQIINPSPSLASLCLVAQHPPRGEASFQAAPGVGKWDE